MRETLQRNLLETVGASVRSLAFFRRRERIHVSLA